MQYKMQQATIRKNVGVYTIKQMQQEIAPGCVSQHRPSWHTQLFVGAYLLLSGIFTLLAFFVHTHPVLHVDVMITHAFQEYQATWLRILMLLVSFPGAYPMFMPVLITLTALVLWIIRLRLEALMVIALPFASYRLNLLLKALVARPRPSANLVTILQPASGYSFPSEHVMSYVAFWGLLFALGLLLFKMNRWWHYVLLTIPAFFVVLVGPSRIYLGAHWASDVFGSYLLGGLLLTLGLWIYLSLKRRGILAPAARRRQKAEIETQPLA